MRLIRAVPPSLALAVAACVPPPPAVIGPQPGIFWQDAGWTVNRFPVPGTFYCSATRDTLGPDFAFNETTGGIVGWNITDTTGSAIPGAVYQVTMLFKPGGPLNFTATLQASTRLSNTPLDPNTAEALPRYAAIANVVDVRSPQLGPVGHFELSGSAAALAALDRCAHGAL